MTEARIWRILDYVIQSFAPKGGGDAVATSQMRSFSKWWLDSIRNLIIVGVLQYFAEKSGLWYVKALSAATYFMFWGYCFSYINSWHFVPFHGMRASWTKFFLSMMAGVLVPMALSMGIGILLYLSVAEIARVQVR